MRIRIQYGKQTFKYLNSRVNIFGYTPEDNKKVFISKVPGVIYLDSGKILASKDGNKSFGCWYNNTYEIPDGLIIVVETKVYREHALYSSGSLFLRSREAGPLLDIHTTLGSCVNAVYNNKMEVFQGNADVLSIKEIKEFGVRVGSSYRKLMMDPEEVEELYGVIVVTKGQPKPKVKRVVNAKGSVIVIPESNVQRRIRVRKRI